MRRRTGSVWSTKEGRWRVVLTAPDGSRKSVGVFATKAEAERHRSAALAIVERELTDGMTVAEFGEQWLTKRELSKHVRDTATEWGWWNKRIAPSPLARLPLKAVRRLDLAEFIDKLRIELSVQSIRNIAQILRTMFRAAVDAGLVRQNPTDELRLPRKGRTSEPWAYATTKEQDALLACFPEPERWIIAFAMGTGLRAGELCALRLADVHIDDPEPHVVVRYGSPPDHPTKTGKIRTVPLFGLGLTAAQMWLGGERYTKRNPHKLMFPRKRGGYRDKNHVLPWEMWSPARDAVFDRPFRWHDLRHTCASSLVSGWWGRYWRLEEVMALLGHSSITLTQRYAHLGESALKRAASETHGNRTPGSQGGGSTEFSRDFLNRRPPVRTGPGVLAGIVEDSGNSPCTPPVQLRCVSFDFLTALSEGRGADAERLRGELVDLLVGSPARVIETAEMLLGEARTAQVKP
jgi:integrase